MTLTRWKLLAGVLGISIAGVVASADPHCSGNSPLQARRPATPPVQNTNYAPTVSIVPLIVPVAANETAQAVTAPPITPTLPMLETLPTVAVPTLNLPDVSPPMVVVPAPKPIEIQPFIAIPDAVKAPAITLPTFTPVADKVIELPLPMTVAKPLPAVAPIPELPVAPIPELATKPPAQFPPTPTPMVREVPAVVASRNPSAKSEETPTEASSVRVVVQLGTAQPKFEVLSGEDVLLKAACEKIDVRSVDKGVTLLKATGGTRFSAPGFEGTCDQLTVLSGTGEVELAGNVNVRCKNGKTEAVIVAEHMRFKLGTAGYSISGPGTISR